MLHAHRLNTSVRSRCLLGKPRMSNEEKIIAYLVSDLHQRLLAKFSNRDRSTDRADWGDIYPIVSALNYASEQAGCVELNAIFDDMLYIIHETNMGAACKGESI